MGVLNWYLGGKMRDYTKQNKAVFLSNGRCVFESDPPRHEAEIGRELPEAPKPTQRKNCETCYYDRGVNCDKMDISFTNNKPLFEMVAQWADANTSTRGKPIEDSDNCPGWKGKEVK